MKSASRLLPSLLLFAAAGACLLWLCGPAPSGSPLAPAFPSRTTQAAPRGAATSPVPRPQEAVELRRASLARSTARASSPPAEPLSPERAAELRRRLEEQKDRQRRERQAQREREEDAWLHVRATQIAEALGLSRGEAASLAALFVRERDLQSAAWTSLDPAAPLLERRRRLAGEMRSIRTWRAEELDRLFGPETARRIEAHERAAELDS